MMPGQVIQHNDLSFLERWTEDVSDVALECCPIQCTINYHGRLRPGQAQRTNQRLISPVISRHLINGTLMAGSTPVPPCHRDVKAALVEKHQALWVFKVRREVIEELRTQFLTAFSGDQRFFYRCSYDGGRPDQLF